MHFLSLYAPNNVSSRSFQLWNVVDVSFVTFAYWAWDGTVPVVWLGDGEDILAVSGEECGEVIVDESDSVIKEGFGEGISIFETDPDINLG